MQICEALQILILMFGIQICDVFKFLMYGKQIMKRLNTD